MNVDEMDDLKKAVKDFFWFACGSSRTNVFEADIEELDLFVDEWAKSYVVKQPKSE